MPTGALQPWDRTQGGGEIPILGNTPNLTSQDPNNSDLTLQLCLEQEAGVGTSRGLFSVSMLSLCGF